jgi:hypothetical protein
MSPKSYLPQHAKSVSPPLTPNAALADHQPFLAIEPVELLVVQHDALAPQQQLKASIPEPPALLGEFEQPVADPHIL